jgi:peptide/nickel transport system permease protein/oligopeptide transport system permease protein
MKHGLRNALLPVTTTIGLQFGQLLGGAILTETIYAWPGMGQLLYQSINSRDYSVVQGVAFVFAFGLIIVNLITDLFYAVIDPRIRYD